MDLITLVLFVAGLVLLIGGAELLVRGASRLAMAVGISPLVVGLTVVALGTSAPELAVGVQSTLAGQTDLTVGNVVGSNIFNVLVILGLASLVTPLVVDRQLVRREVPLMILISVAVYVLAFDGRVSRLEGGVLFAGWLAYTIWSIRESRAEFAANSADEAREAEAAERSSQILNIVLILVGLGLLVLGSRWLVGGAVAVATAMGVSELIIGLTIIAAGTSLPEVATSIVASIRGERDIAVGNAVGSNIFNLLLVLGLLSLIAPGGLPVPTAALGFDIPVMVGVALICLPIFITGRLIARWEGVLFLAYYIAYTLYLILDAIGHDRLPLFNTVMLGLVLPLTAATLMVLMFRSLRASRRRRRLGR